jgi:hypothetical protein
MMSCHQVVSAIRTLAYYAKYEITLIINITIFFLSL